MSLPEARLWRPAGQPFRPFERRERLAGDESLHLDGARVLVFGMGRTGTGAYDALDEQWPGTIVGVDLGAEVAAGHRELGRDVRWGNATSPEFWSRLDRAAFAVDWILLATPNQRANLAAVQLARQWGFAGLIGASAKFADEADELRQNGVDAVFNIYAEAGRGFADHATSLFSGRSAQDLPHRGE
jgi:glutathione-regulated potassium-efflux system ancillary protein KefC